MTKIHPTAALRHKRRARLIERRLRELPQDDGLIPILVRGPLGGVKWALVPPQEVREHFASTMAKHDARRRKLRWGGNQWGEEWVQKPDKREAFNRRMPLLKTDLPYGAWKRAVR